MKPACILSVIRLLMQQLHFQVLFEPYSEIDSNIYEIISDLPLIYPLCNTIKETHEKYNNPTCKNIAFERGIQKTIKPMFKRE